MLEDFEEEAWIPACGFALGLDASLGFVGSDEVEGEAAHHGHVFGSMARAIARQIVFEDDVEQPVHALDAPMAAGSSGKAFDIEQCAGDVIARVEAAAVRVSTRSCAFKIVLMVVKRG